MYATRCWSLYVAHPDAEHVWHAQVYVAIKLTRARLRRELDRAVASSIVPFRGLLRDITLARRATRA